MDMKTTTAERLNCWRNVSTYLNGSIWRKPCQRKASWITIDGKPVCAQHKMSGAVKA